MQKYFRKIVQDLHGYTSPPQKEFKVKLNQNESPFDVPEDIKQELAHAAAHLSWNRYPLNESPQLKEQLAQWHGVDENCILLGNGSNQLLQTILTGIVDKGDAVVYCPPTFSLFDLFSAIYGGQLIEVMRPPGDDFPIEKLLTTVQQTCTKIVLLCSPNNPTGAEISFEDVSRICEKTQGFVMLDEAYAEFSGTTIIPLLKQHPNLIVSRTFSKAFSMAGLRLGYLVANPAIIDQLRKVNLPYNVNLFTEMVAIKLLQHRRFMEEQVKQIIQERDRVFQQMSQISKITVFPSTANFILFRGENGDELFARLKAAGVLVRDVQQYPLLQNYLRVSIGFRDENDFFITALKNIINEKM